MALNIALGQGSCSLSCVYKLTMIYDVTFDGSALAVSSSQVQKPVAMIDFTAVAFLDYQEVRPVW